MTSSPCSTTLNMPITGAKIVVLEEELAKQGESFRGD